MTAIDLTGKTGVIFGVANQRSIAWAIAKALADAGADLAFTYLNERLRGPVEKTVSGLGDPLLVECDATSDEQVANVYEAVSARHGSVDIVIHSVAFADRKDLGGAFSASDLQGFRTALEVSAYTLIPIVSKAVPAHGRRGRLGCGADVRRGPIGCTPDTTSWARPRPRSKTRSDNWPTSSALET